MSYFCCFTIKFIKMKIIKRIFLIIIILGFGVLTFLYFGKYSEGTRAGIIMKVSKKGAIFKTWEGQMNLETFGAINKSSNLVNETFTFSIEKGHPELIKELNDAALSGKRVNLHYYQRYIAVPWRGDTKYFATGVERLNSSQPIEDKEKKFPRN